MCLCLKLLSNRLNHALNSLCNRQQWRWPDWWRLQHRRRCIDKTCESKTNLTMFHLSWNQRKRNGSLELDTFVSVVACAIKDHQHVLNSGPAEAYQPADVREYFRAEYVKIIGLSYVASRQFNHRIPQCPGFVRYEEVEAVLMSDQATQVLRKYPELVSDSEGRSFTADWTWYVPHSTSYK